MPSRNADIAKELDALIAEGAVCCSAVKPKSRLKQVLDSALSQESKGSDGSKETARKKDDSGREDEHQRTFGSQYQAWYSKALRIVEQLLPDRYDEFRELYRLDKKPKTLDEATYRISDYLHGTKARTGGVFGEPDFDTAEVSEKHLVCQVDILASARSRLDSALADISGTLEGTLLDDELATADELLKAKHLRSAGVVAGVVLERHLKRLITNHEITLRKRTQITSLNNALKEARVYDVPRWRQIQRLGDIRNLCGHDAEREPTSEDVEELIRGTEKVVATVF